MEGAASAIRSHCQNGNRIQVPNEKATEPSQMGISKSPETIRRRPRERTLRSSSARSSSALWAPPASSAPYPALSTCLISTGTGTVAENTMLARSEAKLTWALTPSNSLRLRSTRAAHAPQVIPLIDSASSFTSAPILSDKGSAMSSSVDESASRA